MPFFSVIIPLYNKQRYILNTLKSVFAQTLEDFEIIIIDDGTTDESLTVVEGLTDSRIKILHQKNQGVSVARNNGIASSTGQYIALLDADDLWLPDHLISLQRLIKQFPEAGLYCSRYAVKYHEDYIKDIILSRPVAEGMSIISDYFATSMLNAVAWTSAIAFRKNDFLSVGCFDTRIRTGQDVDLSIRFALSFDVAYNNNVTAIYNKGIKNSLSKTTWNDQRDYFINKYTNLEKDNSSLQKYLDLNRFVLAIRTKIAGQKSLYQKQRQDITMKNLYLKQRILLNLPSWILRMLERAHYSMIKNKIYVKPFN